MANKCSIRGFTLLEILVAFSLAAITLGLFYKTATASLDRQTATQRELIALAAAASMIARTGIETPLKEGTLSGSFGQEFTWTTTIRADPDPHASYWLYQIASEVHWEEGGAQRQIRLSTLRLGPREDKP